MDYISTSRVRLKGMLKRGFLLLFLVQVSACSELKEVAKNLPNQHPGLSNQQISKGLKAALQKGIDEKVTALSQENGLYDNLDLRIGLPDELVKVENGLRKIGLDNLADRGIKALNNTAEKAVDEATPIFINAVKNMSVNDARAILLGQNDAATEYLEANTSQELYQKFHPVINNSFQKTGADKIWKNIINRYNQIPFTDQVNPDLTDYVTQQALNRVYRAIAEEELEIRQHISERTSALLQRVFALQDK